MRDEIEQLHKAYCASTGLELRLAYDRENAWYQFIQAGFTLADVQLVGNFLRRAVEKGERNPGCLRFRNMIEPLDYFEEELQLCKAAIRNFKPPRTEKEKVIQAFRPVVGEPTPINPPIPTAEVVQKLVSDLRKSAQ